MKDKIEKNDPALLEAPGKEELASIMENIKNSVNTESYTSPGLSVREIKLKAKNRSKNKFARKQRRVQRKRK